ncbi:MAG TPA: UxaA family hydrolase, partial [Agriterribacter sp.]|nr:UxaA family hydrolase [Agriterribacter sp.]
MSSLTKTDMYGYLRSDGRKGIRNVVLVAYLVECAHHVAREIAHPFKDREVQLIGFGGCYPNAYADKMMNALCVHPNVGAVLLISLGCESFNRMRLLETIAATGRPVKLIGIQNMGGTTASIARGISFIEEALEQVKQVPEVPFFQEDICVGVVCGGSDATSGITSNPAVGNAFDRIVQSGGTALFENTGELIGLEEILSKRA